MPLKSPFSSNLGEIPHRVRVRLAAVPDDFRTWRETISQDPAALLHSPLFRIGLMIIAAGILIAAVQWLATGLTPTGPESGVEVATPWSTVYVACTNPECRRASTARVDRSFKDWPLSCDQCKQRTVYRSRVCADCDQRYAVAPNQPSACPHCAARAAAKPTVADKPRNTTTHSDDDEDPWGP